MPIDPPASGAAGRIAAKRPSIIAVPYDRLVNICLVACIASGAIAFIEPSPYDLLVIILLGVWVMGGFTVHGFVVPFVALIGLYTAGGFLALMPYLNEADPTAFMVQSLYLAISSVFFALFFAQNTLRRAELCLQAYAAACVIAAFCGVAGYFDIAGSGKLFTLYGRASGTFKDPNVFGSFLVLGSLYFIQTLILGRTRHFLAMLVGLLLVAAGTFLSFSRGSWGSLVVGSVLVVGLAYVTSSLPRVRRRIVMMTLIAVGAAVIGLVVLLSIESVRTIFVERFALTQDYDTGETGRFGNQLRAIPMLIERMNGFGPVRFRLFFDEDSHNSYIGAFSSYGWLGGSAFILLVGLTSYIGFRQVILPSPIRRVAQIFWPGLFVLFMQGFQIDIDHWRHVYMMLGAVWGLETARIKWRAREAAGPSRRTPITAAPAMVASRPTAPASSMHSSAPQIVRVI